MIDRNPTRINDKIRVTPVRVIADDGTQLGILETEEALEKARALDLDLVEVAPAEKPPVCRIMDYGKYKYDRKKKSTQSTHNVKLKEIRLRPKTDTHDINFKMKRAKQFLEHKDKVQVSVIFKGREMAHLQEGHKVMERAIEELMEVGKIESAPTQLGRRIVCTIAPK
ncbi:MAG TPA: translation initiation factor IF-3 [Planctomycetes bacterium]|nr:translation initiation factor IF-3 [Planctomycetota bacterium]